MNPTATDLHFKGREKMNRRLTLAAVACVSFILSGRMHAADAKFTLGFDGCADIPAAAGDVKTFDVFATLTTTNNTGTDGAQGWSLSISVDGAAITKVALKGVTVSTIYDEDDDADPTTPPIHHDQFDFDLGSAFTNIQGKASFKDDATKLGAISAGVNKSQEKRVLQPS